MNLVIILANSYDMYSSITAHLEAFRSKTCFKPIYRNRGVNRFILLKADMFEIWIFLSHRNTKGVIFDKSPRLYLIEPHASIDERNKAFGCDSLRSYIYFSKMRTIFGQSLTVSIAYAVVILWIPVFLFPFGAQTSQNPGFWSSGG